MERGERFCRRHGVIVCHDGGGVAETLCVHELVLPLCQHTCGHKSLDGTLQVPLVRITILLY